MLTDFITNHIYTVLITTTFIGILFTPLPNEVVVASSALLSKVSGESIILCFITVLLTSILAISLLEYIGGKLIGERILTKFIKRNPDKLKRTVALLEKYGNVSLIFCYFIPLIRHLIPILAGMNKMNQKTYLFFTTIGGFIWTSIYFIPFLFIPEINAEVIEQLAMIIALVLLSFLLITAIKKRMPSK